MEACEPPRRLLLLTMQPGQPDEHFIEVTLAADGDQTILVWEERGMPLDLLAAYGAGIQVHVEDLAAHLAGRERCDADARWDELLPAYQDLAASAGEYGGSPLGFDLGLSVAKDAATTSDVQHGFRADTSNIIDNNNFGAPDTVNLAGAKAFQIQGGCTWRQEG